MGAGRERQEVAGQVWARKAWRGAPLAHTCPATSVALGKYSAPLSFPTHAQNYPILSLPAPQPERPSPPGPASMHWEHESGNSGVGFEILGATTLFFPFEHIDMLGSSN